LYRSRDRRPAPHSAWLGHEVAGWKADGIITDDQAALVLGRYHAVRRLELSRIALWLGAGFVGIGIIWLVAANLDQLPPLGRFVAVTLLWLGSLVAAEVLDRRIRTRRSPSSERPADSRPALRRSHHAGGSEPTRPFVRREQRKIGSPVENSGSYAVST
jgi:hypothetical protein